MKPTVSKPAKTAVLVLLVFLQLLGSRADEGSIRRSKVLDPRYHISWEIDGSSSGSKITFNITAETKGYVGFGLSTNGAMSKADIVIGGVRDGIPYLNDYHGPSVGNGMPTLDKHNDYHLIDAWENETHTYLAFVRELETCDSEDIPITGTGLKVIWSLGSSDDLRMHRSGNRGSSSVYFLDPEQPLPDLSKYDSHDVTTTLEVPINQTTYWCSIHQLPKLAQESHMVAYEPYFGSSEAKRFTHHMLMYACPYQHVPQTEDDDPLTADQNNLDNNLIEDPSNADTTSYSYWANKGRGSVDCFKIDDENNKPLLHGPCQRIEYGWALGGGITVNPPQVGFPFISGQFYRLEVHLDNPDGVQGVEITVGFRIHYTNETRPMKGSLIEMKAIVGEILMIPPNSAGFTIASHCAASCTDHPEMPTEGITVFSAFLHAHTSGRGIRVRHFRGDEELPWIINDENFDFNYQSHRPLDKNVTILAGDHLIAECTYDTNWKSGKAVLGGPGTADEMCMVVLSYFPAIEDFLKCEDNLISRDNLTNFLGINYLAHTERATSLTAYLDPMVKIANGTEMRFSKAVEAFNWTFDERKKYQELQRYGTHSVHCSSKIDQRTYPENVTEYTEPKDSSCSESSNLKEELPFMESSLGRQLFPGFWIFFTSLTIRVYCIGY